MFTQAIIAAALVLSANAINKDGGVSIDSSSGKYHLFGWEGLKNSYTPYASSWKWANIFCKRKGMELASIKTKAAAEEIDALIKSLPNNPKVKARVRLVWVGANRRLDPVQGSVASDTWVWSADKTPVALAGSGEFSYWNKSYHGFQQPHQGNGPSGAPYNQCGGLYRTAWTIYDMKDHECNYDAQYLCEGVDNTVAPTPTPVATSVENKSGTPQDKFVASLANQNAWDSYKALNTSSVANKQNLRAARTTAVKKYFAAVAKAKMSAGPAASAKAAAIDAAKKLALSTEAQNSANDENNKDKKTVSDLKKDLDASTLEQNKTKAEGIAAIQKATTDAEIADEQDKTATDALHTKWTKAVNVQSASQDKLVATTADRQAKNTINNSAQALMTSTAKTHSEDVAAEGVSKAAAQAAHKAFVDGTMQHFNSGNF